ncbi:box C/D snoRNA protein 1 [Scaptodrosophila lebanonensis]|uniref:Box C/D snoRNA protein 1 n=1 Tax=Drosophila lebanonensis TaxID=7225 RepID=A0A6J2TVS0_DROLE|nr:box C/D snoRNA protein 1 [Scaptodrosophila lebanonensis]XP_030379646.1 box C/D snoRNA protein 1 [Scaptodrosophila lebanonensis]XP_030379647.1 box C/D snoRNA protein 1 [Scaptodrosophila lebanonensis]
MEEEECKHMDLKLDAKTTMTAENMFGSQVVDESELSTNKNRTMRLGLCEVCARIEARYCCPKCEVKTCCLACVQIHKRELKCDGIRDRTKYLPLHEMTAREFMSDYCFLEECTRFTEDRKRDKIKRYTRQQAMVPLPQHRMRSAALERGTRLHLLLPNFTRHKQNTTYLNWKLNRLYWRVEWVFLNASVPSTGGDDVAPARFVDARCDEQQTLAELLLKYVDLEQDMAREQHKLLCYYQSAGIAKLHALLRAEGVRNCSSRYYALDMQKTLRENLAGKTVIEFPTIHVTYEEQLIGYNIIDSDEEAEGEANEASEAPQPGKTTSKRQVKHQKSNSLEAKKVKTSQSIRDIAELEAAFENNDMPSSGASDTNSDASDGEEAKSDHETALKLF